MAKSREAFRTISEVAEWLDVQTHVLRFWESKFSQVKPVKRAGGRRYYRPQDMELLGGLKKLLHEDGMPIKDAQQLLREKGVKHVSSLSRPVDQEDQPVEATVEDVTEETAQEPVETPQQEPQVDLQPDEALESEPAQDEPVEAKDEDIEDAEEADEPLEYVAEGEAIAAPEDTHEEVSEETLYAAPDDFEPDVAPSSEDDAEEDEAAPHVGSVHTRSSFTPEGVPPGRKSFNVKKALLIYSSMFALATVTQKPWILFYAFVSRLHIPATSHPL